MKEIWKASHKPHGWVDYPVSPILGWWWFLWIVSNVIAQASFRLAMRAEELEELLRLNVINQAAEVSGILLSITTLVLVNRISEAQLLHVETRS